MQHIIKKQVIELEIDRQLDAFGIQQQVSDWYWRQFLSLLEAEFNKLAGPDEVLYIDRLEIDLGMISVRELQKTQLNNIVLPVVAQQLHKNFHSAQPNTAIVRRQGPLHSFTQWLHYMQKGFLPWSVWHITAQWLQQVLETLATDHDSVSRLRTELQKNNMVVARIVQQHTPVWLAQLITVLTAENQSSLPDVIAELEALFISVHKHPGTAIPTAVATRKQIWQQILFAAAATQQKLTTIHLAIQIIREHITREQVPVLKKIQAQATAWPQLQPLLPAVIEQLQQATASHSEHTVNNNTDEAKESPATSDKPLPQADTIQKLLKAEDGLFVQHAGLVLLHPFLRSLFSLCGLLEGRTFANEASRQKAIYLLHYIATGNITAEEHELVMPKVLCSYPVSAPINTDTTLSSNELQEADDLMRAAIAQWGILKNTSPDGLRQGFLQRNGKLHTKNEQLYIELEKSAIDVLLDHLPWNLSLIRLPWSGDIIRVEWR